MFRTKLKVGCNRQERLWQYLTEGAILQIRASLVQTEWGDRTAKDDFGQVKTKETLSLTRKFGRVRAYSHLIFFRA